MITHQKQPTKNSCVITCLAMLLDKPVLELYEYHHDDIWNGKKRIFNILDDYGIDYFCPTNIKATLVNGFIYLLQVPSLNNVGLFHQILAVYHKNIMTVFDPQNGNDNKKHYVWKGGVKNDLEFELHSWIIDAVIPINSEGY